MSDFAPLQLQGQILNEVIDCNLKQVTLDTSAQTKLEKIRSIVSTLNRAVSPDLVTWFEIINGLATLRFATDNFIKGATDFRVVHISCVMIEMIQAALGEDWFPHRVDLDVSSLPPMLTKGFKYPIYLTKGRNAIPLNIPLCSVDIKKHLDIQFNAPLRASVKVKHFISTLGADVANIELVSQMFGISRRTMHRILKDEGVSFKGLILDVRMQKAKLGIIEGASLDRVSRELGYSNVSNFIRAYRSYYGLHPRSIIG